MLLLFAGSQSSPAHGMLQPTAAQQTKSSCHLQKQAWHFSTHLQWPMPTVATTPHWAAPLTCQELSIPQGVSGARKAHSLWSQRPRCAAPTSGSVTLDKSLHLSEPHFSSLKIVVNDPAPLRGTERIKGDDTRKAKLSAAPCSQKAFRKLGCPHHAWRLGEGPPVYDWALTV